MDNDQDSKKQESELRTLIRNENILSYVEAIQKNEGIVELVIDGPMHDPKGLRWVGSKYGVAGLGYPFITTRIEEDEVLKISRRVAVFPKEKIFKDFDLINLGFSTDHDCFLVVRSDAYEVIE